MKTQQEITARIAYLKHQKEQAIKEELWTATAIFQAQIETLEWVQEATTFHTF
jgi:hypothetical protein